MKERLKQSIKDNRDKIVIAGLCAVTVSIGAYSLKTRTKFHAERDSLQQILEMIDSGYTLKVDWDNHVVRAVDAE